jgi:hypothetical protein
MKIIQEGIMPKRIAPHSFRGKCYNCGCEFRCTEADTRDGVYDYSYYATCPMCSKSVSVYYSIEDTNESEAK